MYSANDFLWTAKYRPRKLKDCILPKTLKDTLYEYVASKQIPNVIFYGPAGTGKTSAAMALCDEIGAEYLLLHCGREGDIATLRTKVMDFASIVSFAEEGIKKYVILDEGDRLTAQTMDGLKSFMEEFSANCGFIVTSNHLYKLTTELRSRLPAISFQFSKSDRPDIIAAQYKAVKEIMAANEKPLSKEDQVWVGQLLLRNYPDFRKTLNELQAFNQGESLGDNTNIDELVGFIKTRSYDKVRVWVAENDTDPQGVFEEFYKQAESLLKKDSVPTLVVLLGEYQYKSNFVLDQQINLAAFLAQVMVECEWK